MSMRYVVRYNLCSILFTVLTLVIYSSLETVNISFSPVNKDILVGFANSMLENNSGLLGVATSMKDVPITRDNMTYLGIKDGPQDCLVLAWSATDENNMFMTTIRALEKLVGSVEVALFRIAVDPGCRCQDLRIKTLD
uniref:Uncharacterized protein n=1 Tax=Setaria viridis TaxID=4556 RepID=A0A4U6UYU9_SETVI|nr:hypothetical protein SEVIR_4G148700v2 [Setaria viridis]